MLTLPLLLMPSSHLHGGTRMDSFALGSQPPSSHLHGGTPPKAASAVASSYFKPPTRRHTAAADRLAGSAHFKPPTRRHTHKGGCDELGNLLQATYTAAHKYRCQLPGRPITSSHLHGGTHNWNRVFVHASTSSHLHGGTLQVLAGELGEFTSSHLHGGTPERELITSADAYFKPPTRRHTLAPPRVPGFSHFKPPTRRHTSTSAAGPPASNFKPPTRRHTVINPRLLSIFQSLASINSHYQ